MTVVVARAGARSGDRTPQVATATATLPTPKQGEVGRATEILEMLGLGF